MVAIKDMETLPSCCHWDCPLCNEDGGECMLGSHDTKTDTTKERAKDCSLVEVEEHKVGKWITNPNKMKGAEIECSKCGVSALSKIGIQVCSDFCPNCGAEMRGSNND